LSREPPMNIADNMVVTISFKLFDAANTLLEESPEPMVYLHGTHSGMFPKIEEKLNGKKVGDMNVISNSPVKEQIIDDEAKAK
jgi:FKBP-type peptidyl-prolyl cis-trans isomerase SlyD